MNTVHRRGYIFGISWIRCRRKTGFYPAFFILDMEVDDVRDKIKMMMVLLLGGFITSFSETLLNNALPIIMEELHIS